MSTLIVRQRAVSRPDAGRGAMSREGVSTVPVFASFEYQ